MYGNLTIDVTSSEVKWLSFSLAISSQRTVATMTYQMQLKINNKWSVLGITIVLCYQVLYDIANLNLSKQLNKCDVKLYLMSRKIKILIFTHNLPYVLRAKGKPWSRNNTSSITCKSSWGNWMHKPFSKFCNLLHSKCTIFFFNEAIFISYPFTYVRNAWQLYLNISLQWQM